MHLESCRTFRTNTSAPPVLSKTNLSFKFFFMRHYLLFALFTLGFILSIIERIQFERKKKHEKDAEYRSLFRRHSTLLIIFFAYLAAEHLEPVYQALCGE